MFIMASITTGIKWLLSVAVIGGGTYLTYKYLNGNKQAEKHPTPVKSQDSSSHVVELSSIAKYFRGSMNPLLSVITEYDKDSAVVLFENVYQIVDGHSDDTLRLWKDSFFASRESWTESAHKEKAKIIISLLKQCGITCVQESTVIWNEALKDKYNKLMPLEDGQTCKVMAPYWVFDNSIFEKGIIINS